MISEASRTILITGTSGEIGFHLAAHFLGDGWTVMGIDKCDPVEGDMLPGLVSRRCDLSNALEAAQAIDDLASSHGAFDVVINCAGKIANAPLVSFGEQGWTVHQFSLWDEVLSSCLTAAFNTTAISVRHMVEARKKGVIVNVSSVCARGTPGQAAYSAAKAGLNGLTLALAKELGPLGIRVVGLLQVTSTRNP